MSEHSKPTQNKRILDYINQFGSITQLDALRDLGVMRLASRISDLRRQGWSIVSKVDTVENRFGEKCRIKRYSLEVYNSENCHCVSCNAVIPEGRMVCPNCEEVRDEK